MQQYEQIDGKDFTYLRPVKFNRDFFVALGMAWLIVVFGAALYLTL